MRLLIKSALERVAVGTGLTSALLEWGQPSTAILAYHNVLPAGSTPSGDLALHVDQARFAEHLDRLTQTHDVVPLCDVFAEWDDSDRPKAVLTFDDAYVGALTVGLGEVTARSLPATVFVAPGLLGAEAFWWDTLASDDRKPLAPSIRHHALSEHAGEQDRVLQWATSENLSRASVGSLARPADLNLLRRAAELPGVTLGSHTWGHPNLSALAPQQCRAEVERGHVGLVDALEGRGRVINWLAYPYGLASDAAVTAAGKIMTGATLVTGGLARQRRRPEPHPLRLPRVSVPRGLSADGLSLRLAGMRGQ